MRGLDTNQRRCAVIVAIVASASVAGVTFAAPALAVHLEQYIEVPQCQPATSEDCPQIPQVTFTSVKGRGFTHSSPQTPTTALTSSCAFSSITIPKVIGFASGRARRPRRTQDLFPQVEPTPSALRPGASWAAATPPESSAHGVAPSASIPTEVMRGRQRTTNARHLRSANSRTAQEVSSCLTERHLSPVADGAASVGP